MHAELRVAVRRVDGVDLDQRGGQEPLDLGHRRDEAFAPRLAQRLEKRARKLVAAPVEQLALREPGWREPRRADAPVVLARLDADEPAASSERSRRLR